jgi:hypothetical protein
MLTGNRSRASEAIGTVVETQTVTYKARQPPRQPKMYRLRGVETSLLYFMNLQSMQSQHQIRKPDAPPWHRLSALVVLCSRNPFLHSVYSNPSFKTRQIHSSRHQRPTVARVPGCVQALQPGFFRLLGCTNLLSNSTHKFVCSQIYDIVRIWLLRIETCVAIASTRLQLIADLFKVRLMACMHPSNVLLGHVMQDSSALLSRSPREGRPGAAELMQPAGGTMLLNCDAQYGEVKSLQRRQRIH